MTTSEVTTAFGAFYKDGGQGQKDIYQKLMRGFVTDQAFTKVVTDDQIWRASEAVHTRIVQPFQKAFTPTGSATFKPVEIRQFNLKADLLEFPDDIKSSWLGFLASNDVKRTDWPFVRFWIEKMVIPQINQDIELNEVGRGVYAAPTVGTPGAAGTAMNGILKIIADHITASRITPIALGAVPTDDPEALVEYFEAYFAAIPLPYRNLQMTTYVPEWMILEYKKGYEKKYGLLTNSDVTSNGVTSIRFSSMNLVGLPSMNLKANGTLNDRFFTTPKSNAIMLQRAPQNKGIFDVQAFDRSVKLLTDFWIGIGFIIPELVWVNDGAA